MINFQQLSLTTIIQRYDEELQVSREHEVGYGFELFRRAVEDRDTHAWDAIHERHHRLIYSWIERGTTGTLSSDEKDDLCQEIWLKFYRNLIKSTDLAYNFKHIGSLFNYLKKCVFTVTHDHYRRLTKQKKLQNALAENSVKLYTTPNNLDTEWLARQSRLEAIKEWIATSVTDPEEQLIIHCSYELDLTPGEIYQRYPGRFQSVRRIYRIKERILKRAKRSFEQSGI
ncbi:MAG: RNA polymerase sigma factor [Ardenticatenaceae bacterium]